MIPMDDDAPSFSGYHWVGFGVALVVHLVIDLGTTLWLASLVGPAGELNPLMRWLIRQHLGLILGMHAIVGSIALLSFLGVVRVGNTLNHRVRLQYIRVCEVWIGVLILTGGIVVLNNASMIAVTI